MFAPASVVLSSAVFATQMVIFSLYSSRFFSSYVCQVVCGDISQIIPSFTFYQTSRILCLCSCTVSGCMHKTSTLIYDHGIHGAWIFVLFDPHEWSEEET